MKKTIIALFAGIMTVGTVSAQTINVYNGDKVVGTYTIGVDADRVEFVPAESEYIVECDPDRTSGKQYGSSNNFGVTLRKLQDGIDYEISLDLYDDEGKEKGYLTAGTYTVGNTSTDGSLNYDYSYLQKDNDQYKFSAGTLNVEIESGNYKMRLDVTLSNGERFIATYLGAIDGFEIK